jgi:hypothetical protein
MDENPEMKMDELVKKVSNILYISAQSFRIFDEKLRFLERVQTRQMYEGLKRYCRRWSGCRGFLDEGRPPYRQAP